MEIFPWHVLFDWDYLQGKIAVRRSWLWDCLSTLSCVQKQPYMPKFWTRDYTQSTYIFIWTTKIIDNACLLQIIADDLIPNISNLWTCLPRTFFNSSSGLVIALLPNFFHLQRVPGVPAQDAFDDHIETQWITSCTPAFTGTSTGGLGDWGAWVWLKAWISELQT